MQTLLITFIFLIHFVQKCLQVNKSEKPLTSIRKNLSAAKIIDEREKKKYYTHEIMDNRDES